MGGELFWYGFVIEDHGYLQVEIRDSFCFLG